MGKKVYLLEDSEKELSYAFTCNGCRCEHFFMVRSQPGMPKWTWNENWEAPTVRPSIDYFRSNPAQRCHFIITDGVIKYLSDCYHHLKGQDVPMEDAEE